MDHGANPADLERRKQIKIRLRPDLSITPQKYEGRTYYVVKDPVAMRYYRFKEQEHFLLGFMDGQHTLDDAQKKYEGRFRPERLKLEDLEHFAQQLLTAGLAQNDSPRAGKQLFDRRKKRRRSEIMQAVTNILYIKIPIFDPDRLLGWMMRYMGWIFTSLFGLISVGFMMAALMLVLMHWETFYDRLPYYQDFFRWKNLAYMWLALGIVKVIHEFGHGLSCKAFGGEVHEMGALFLVFSPCLYCNVSDAWTLPNKWKRIIISFAGIWVELIIASIATFVWWNTPSSPGINNMALCLMVVCSVSTVVFNANPLMRYDGYYMMADWLEIPNLRDRSNRYLKNVVLEHCLGVEVQPEPYMATTRKVLFIGYAIVSYVYRWVVTFSILVFMATFLKPYKLEVVSQMLAAAALASMVGWPAWRLGKNLHRRGRLPDMKTGRAVLSGIALAAVVLAFFLVPLPMSWVRETALVQLKDDAADPVLLQESGRLERLMVRDGQMVEKDQELAVFSNRELDFLVQGKKTEVAIRLKEVATLNDQFGKSQDLGEKNRLGVRLTTKLAEQRSLEAEIAVLQERQSRLILRAPRAGRVITPPRVEEVGRFFEYNQPQPFCLVGDTTQLCMVVPLKPADYRLLRVDAEALREAEPKNNEDATAPRTNSLEKLRVTVRITGRDRHVWEGKLTHLPESDARQIPLALSHRAGGPIAVKPDSSDPNALIPQEQFYLAKVDLIDPDGAICPGTLGQVKIQCRWQSMAWWTWRKANDLFDLGLIDY